MKNILSFETITDKDGNVVNVEKAFMDYYNHYRMNNNLTKRTLEFSKTSSFSEKDKNINKLLLSCAEKIHGSKKPDMLAVESWALNPSVQYATYAVVTSMIDYVLPDTLIDSISMYTEIKSASLGDTLSYVLKPRSLYTVYETGNGRRSNRGQNDSEVNVTLNPAPHTITVMSDLYDIMVGKKSLAEFVTKAIRSIETQITYDCYDAFNVALSDVTLPSELVITNFTTAGAVKLAQTVTAWNGGNEAMFVGTKLAISKIFPDATGARYDVDSDFVKVGHLKEYNGYKIMELPQIADYKAEATYGLKLDDNKIYVISNGGDKIVKLGLEGATTAFNESNNFNADLTQKVTLTKRWDAEVITSDIAGLIKLS